EQVGPAKQVYRQPASRFVAEFVGTNNILGGRVERVADGHAVVATPVGPLRAALRPEQRPAAGDPVHYVVSADSITLSAGANGEADNVVEATMVSEQFVGSVVTVYAETAGGEEFRVQASQNELAGIDLVPGGALHLTWRAESAYLLPSG